MRFKTYLDTSILISWILSEEPNRLKKLSKNSKKCKQLLDYIENNDIDSSFVTSDWAMSEMIQTFVDKAIFKQFELDGYEISSFNRMKNYYIIRKDDINIINESLNQFEHLIKNLGIHFIKTDIDWRKIHHYCMDCRIETPDAIHLQNAIQNNCNYLTTTDNVFTKINTKHIDVIDPSNLISKTSLKKK